MAAIAKGWNNMVEKIVVFGTGGFGREVEEMLRDINRKERAFDVLGYWAFDAVDG